MRAATFLLSFALMMSCACCSPAQKYSEVPEQAPNNGNGNNPSPGESGGNTEDHMKIKISVGSHTFAATLEDSAAAKAFMEMLPLTLNMDDVNSNEKYFQLGQNLPVSSSNPGMIRSGDLMLWGSNGLVLFYKTFSTSYSYTRLGAIDSPEGLESVLGSGSVRVSFEAVEE